jgi:putative membrane protein
MTWSKQSFVAVAVVVGAAALALAQQQQDQQSDRGRDRTGQAAQRDQSGQAGQGQDASDQARQAGQSSRRGQGDQQGQGQAGRGQAADRQIEQLLSKIAEDPDTAADKVFLLTAVLNNQVQIQLAQQVMQKTQNNQVKRLAQRMVQELSKEDQDLRQLAQSMGVQIPEGLARADALEVDIVAALPADQIDKAYVSSVEADGANDMSSFQSQGQIGQDQRVRQIAQEEYRTQQARSQEATQTGQALGMRGGSDAQPAGANLRGNGGNERRGENSR